MLSFRIVMAGDSSLPCADHVHLSALPATHVLSSGNEDVEARAKPWHDEFVETSNPDETAYAMALPPEWKGRGAPATHASRSHGQYGTHY